MKNIIIILTLLISSGINAQSAENVVGIKTPNSDTLYLDNSEVSTLITMVWEKPNIPYVKPVIIRITREELLVMLSRKEYNRWVTN
jgi:hypothetical protein